MPEQGNHDGPPKFTRRRVLQFTGAAAASAVAGRVAKYIEVSTHQPISQETSVNESSAPDTIPAVNKTPEQEADVQTFKDQQTEAVAQSLGLHAGSFFDVDDHIPETYTAYKSGRLLPIFHPAVLKQKDLIYALSDKYTIPPNAIATIMTIESGGDPNAKSEAGATGLFQLLPQFHLQDVSEDQYNDPWINGTHAMEYFTECLNDARSYLESANPGKTYAFQHPDIFLRAYAIYNAGAENAKKDFRSLFPETQEYIRIANRLFKVLEIAGKMRESGMNDQQIVKNLCSLEVDARARGLSDVPDSLSSEKKEALLHYVSNVSIPKPTTALEQTVFDMYNRYKNGMVEKYEYPLNPALRVDPRFVLNNPTNSTIANWFAIDTTLTDQAGI